jgi:preprotein translocase subunit SecA
MIQNLMKKVFGSKNEREIKRMQPLVSRINGLEDGIRALSDAELQAQTPKFKERIAKGEGLDDLLPEAFATMREAARRRLGMRHYDVQLIGGIALHRGVIAEMKTGEGKTLVATLAVYLNALMGRGVHVVTVNDYLAQRDAEWMAQVYRWLGLSVGVVLSRTSDEEHRDAYWSDITYGQNNEFGFDYLRDNMKFSKDRRVQRELYYAIVDEVDSILIDEARTPLIISGRAERSSDLYYKVNDMIRPLKRDQDYLVDEKSHTVTLTEVGVDKIERKQAIDNLYAPENTELLHHIHQALRAHSLYKRDVNYLVEEGKVVIVDEFTGRKMPGRRWSDGLHQAVEAKEGLKIQDENQTLATVTFQNYFRQYEKLSGMTGTADTEAEEFASIYGLDVLVIPTNRPILRADHDDVVYTKEKGKVRAIIDDIVECHKRGQPVLVGTTSVDKSEFISKLLHKEGVPHHVLNAKYHAMEASIVAQAGRYGAVTIATNMAGRGTDIVLGGNPEFLAHEEVGEEATEEELKAAMERARAQCLVEREQVLVAGGLHIVGSERHESRRIDNQLRGRSGRQGDPGSSRFFLSLEDDLLRIFGAERIQKMMERFNVPDDEPIMHRWVSKAIENAQRKVEARNFDIRKNLLEYDDVMNQQRTTIYAMRDEIIGGVDSHELLFAAVDDVVDELVHTYLDAVGEDGEERDLRELEESVLHQFKVTVDLSKVRGDTKEIIGTVAEAMKADYKEREARIISNIVTATRYELEERYRIAVARAEAEGKPVPEHPVLDEDKLGKLKREEWQNYERTRYLQAIDGLWKDHLQAMSHLKEGIHLHAYAQKDPKLIYKKEAFELFGDLVGQIRTKAVETAFLQEVRTEAEMKHEIESRRRALDDKLAAARQAQAAQQASASPQQPGGGGGEAAAEARQAAARPVQYVREKPKVGRNDPCYCGSGKKYKKCHLPEDEAEMAATA